jgi:hypothetical protein
MASLCGTRKTETLVEPTTGPIMSDFNLDETLRRAKAPGRPEEYWAEFPARVVRQLGRAAPARPVERRWLVRLGWGFAVATACLIVGFAVGLRHGKREGETAAANGLLQNTRLIRETMGLFPNRVRAIVQDERGLSIVLSEDADVPVSAPLYVKVCDGAHCVSLVTFSGQQVEIAGQKVTVLSDADGGVIVAGERFVWSSGHPSRIAGNLRIEARELSPSNAG